MRRALLVLVLALFVLVACRPLAVSPTLELESTSSPPTSTTSTTLEPEPAFTADEVRYLAAMAERDAAARAFLEHVAAIRAAVPWTLRVIGWCEGGRYLGLEFPLTNYAALNQQGSTASGGYQVLDSTWRTWRTYVAGAGVYERAVHAPDFVQDAVATAAYHREGTTPWNASRSCWVMRV